MKSIVIKKTLLSISFDYRRKKEITELIAEISEKRGDGMDHEKSAKTK